LGISVGKKRGVKTSEKKVGGERKKL
jgi:hypothetical protein